MNEQKVFQEEAEYFLSKIKGMSHLKVRSRGNTLTIESVDEEGITYPHARLKRKSVHKWYLEMPVKRGWEATFMEGTIEELIVLLVEKFPWCLAPLFHKA